MKQISLVGVGMGNRNTLTLGGWETIQQADCLIGAPRLLEEFSEHKGEKIPEIGAEQIAHTIDSTKHQRYAVLLSGDLGFYSGAKKLYSLLEDYPLEAFPGISTVQYFASRLHRPWQDFHCVSGHGVAVAPLGEIATHKETFFLTDQTFRPEILCQMLVDSGWGEFPVCIGEKLSYPEERILTGKAKDFTDVTFSTPNVVLVENPRWESNPQRTYGLADEVFVRGKVPMTKEEVRTVILSKLELREQDVIYDIGAGTGSVAVEMAKTAVKGRVYAVEKNPEGVQLIEKNAAALEVPNLTVIEGSAPQALEGLPPPDKVFIGGSTGELEEILKLILQKNPQVAWVATGVTLETLGQLTQVGKTYGTRFFQVLQLAVTEYQPRGSYHMAQAQNPIFIVTGRN